MPAFDQLKKEILNFRKERDWSQFHDPKNLAEGLSIEAAELLEVFLWKTTENARNLDQKELQSVKEELADIFIFMTYIADEFKFDLLKEVLLKLKLNAEKYPIHKSRGNSKKYTEL